MILLESIFIALRALTSNKLRTILTMLGIIIGVGAVISLISIGNGFRQQLNDSFTSLGTNVIWVVSGRFSFGGNNGNPGNAKQTPPQPLTLADAQAIGDPLLVSDVVAVSPEYGVGNLGVVRGQVELSVSVTGVSAEYESVRATRPVLGQFIEPQHIDRRTRVAVLGATVAEELFESYEYPIGEMIRIGGIPFEVIGVLEEKGQSGFGTNETDNGIFIPISTAQTRLGSAGSHHGSLIVSTIFVQATSQDRMDAITEQINTVMRDRHKLLDEETDDFTVTSQAELLAFGNTITAGLTAFLGSIAGVSLLVGGIGIMNIMLVSVTERTREIGIRKAVGAKRRDIMFQFLVEATVISLIGGMFGIGLGYGVSQLLPRLIPNLGETVVTLDSILLATSFALAIGLFFGVYPATRASRLKPIEALRYE
ncbi:MAG TPA: ABC transporter permease [Anaerolineae bacterium]|nr:ABC transporter permease [Anaerolineae bacterium]MCB0181565.1 ABC transporter permease [Anaerolineae bacterium]MCB0226684.1 ABC transporter permease [Anaerolineae bacterium]MCB9108931.1 ABC transporter permease [Anaerolineales bacterium]HRV93837.1 ABC transporter permease [Anaerolineae bacterium]